MDASIESVVLDLVDWLAARERTCEEVVHAWQSRTTLPIWQEAHRRELVINESVNGRCIVRPTSLGLILGELRRAMRRQVRQPRSDMGSTHEHACIP
jgi:hypothetical protein